NAAAWAGRRGPVLPPLYDRRASTFGRVARRTAAYCARTGAPSRNAAARVAIAGAAGRHHQSPLHHLLEDFSLHAARHAPTLRAPHELVVVPEPAEKRLVALAGKHHRVEADHPR